MITSAVAGMLCYWMTVAAAPLQPVPPDLLPAMVKFDRVYIPTLAMTSQGNVDGANKAVKRLVTYWEDFRGRFYNAYPGDEEWKPNFDQIGESIAKGADIITSGGDLKAAHEALERVRQVFWKLRARNGVPYYIDRLTAYHEPMEAIVLAAMENEKMKLSPADRAALQTNLKKAETRWRAVLNTPFNAELFGFDDQEVASMKRLIANESKALSDLATALQSGDDKEIIQKAKAIKAPFAQLFMSFGSFEGMGS